jgi:hypothetical protein
MYPPIPRRINDDEGTLTEWKMDEEKVIMHDRSKRVLEGKMIT